MRRASVANVEWQQVLNARRPEDERRLDADPHGLWPATECWEARGGDGLIDFPSNRPSRQPESTASTPGGFATPCDHGQLVVRQVTTSMR